MNDQIFPPPKQMTSDPRSVESETVTIRDEWDSLFKSINFWLNHEKGKNADQLVDLIRDTGFSAFRFYEFFDRVPPANYQLEGTNADAVLHQARVRLVAEWDTTQQALEQRDRISDEQEQAWRAAWPQTAELEAPDGRGQVELMIQDLPGIIEAILNVRVLAEAGPSLAALSKAGKFYSPERHQRVLALAGQMTTVAALDRGAIIELTAASQLAIQQLDADKLLIRKRLGFYEDPYWPASQALPAPKVAALNTRFDDYLADLAADG
jgi:hypothetical protein